MVANTMLYQTNIVFFSLQEKVAKAQEVKDLAMANLTQAIKDETKEQWRVEGRQMLFDAKRVRSDDPVSGFLLLFITLMSLWDIKYSLCYDLLYMLLK